MPESAGQAPTAAPPAQARRRGVNRTRQRLRAKLRSRTAIRDAFLLHEVLGPPVGLRRHHLAPPTDG